VSAVGISVTDWLTCLHMKLLHITCGMRRDEVLSEAQMRRASLSIQDFRLSIYLSGCSLSMLTLCYLAVCLSLSILAYLSISICLSIYI